MTAPSPSAPSAIASSFSAAGTGRTLPWTDRRREYATLTILCGANAALCLLTAAGAMAAGLRADAFFGEGTVITAWSAAQIVAVAGVSMWIFRMRRAERRRPRHANPRLVDVSAAPLRSHWLWAFAAVGFLFLACDEALAIHEWLDHRLHAALALRESPWSDRIDDLIVLGYGAFGLGAMLLWRGELRLFNGLRRLFVIAFALFFSMVALDLLTNGYGVDVAQSTHRARLEALMGLGNVAEETCKLLGESAFLAAFLAAAETVRRRTAHE